MKSPPPLPLPLVLLLITATFILKEVSSLSFTIDYENDTFLKDGEKFRYASGSIHYFRSPEDRWDSLLRKMRLGGLNAVTTYIPWNLHQPHPPLKFDYTGNLNLFKFLELAKKNGLLVILRPSPFIDAERDMGGLPAWLLWMKPGIRLRSSDLDYNYYVSRWYDELLPKLSPYLYSNGGPVIAMQVENEFGSTIYSPGVPCDKNYTAFLRDLLRHHLGPDLVLFTNDGAAEENMKCGSVEGVYATLDFGPGTLDQINASFALQRKYSPKGPLVNSEFYPGWLDHWQKPHSKTKTSVVANALDAMLSLGANVNIYMFHGGTSFGYGAGANIDGTTYDPCPTSYDYDAPLTEAGDPTDKYFAIKGVIAKYLPVPPENPQRKEKAAYGKVVLQRYTTLFDPEFLVIFSGRTATVTDGSLPSFEDLKTASGFVLYQTAIEFKTSDPIELRTPSLRDRGYVFVDEVFAGILSRTEEIYSIPLKISKGQTLSILVENQGRMAVGGEIGETKGLGSNVTLGTHDLSNSGWTIYPLGELDGRKLLKYSNGNSNTKEDPITSIRNGGSGRFYVGNFTPPPPSEGDMLDTYVRLDGFHKGLVWVNGVNLGRYWPVVGPQETLYLPSSFLNRQSNTFIVFELERSPDACSLSGTDFDNGDCFITLTDTHVIDADTPYRVGRS